MAPLLIQSTVKSSSRHTPLTLYLSNQTYGPARDVDYMHSIVYRFLNVAVTKYKWVFLFMQVKFSELTLDMFRMLQTLEREPQEDLNNQIYDASPAPGRTPFVRLFINQDCKYCYV